MGGENVKLISLHIERLYGFYNYDINFNPDVTFIYGVNGCGKTTILNITEAIITGHLFKLFDYQFEKITLHYAKSINMGDMKIIEIDKKKDEMRLNFENNQCSIERLLNTDDGTRKIGFSYNPRTQAYFNKYSILEDIKETFNYVYLPLNRAVIAYDDNLMYRRTYKRFGFETERLIEPEDKDLAMLQVENIIEENVSRINSKIGTASDRFRNKILKSLIDVNNQVTFSTLVSSLFEEQNILQIQNDYIRLLNDLSLIDEVEKESYEEFFQKIVKEFKQEKNELKSFNIDLVLKFNEILRIKNLVILSENLEKQKAIIRQPLDIFLDTMNQFVKNSDDGKTIKVDKVGKVYFVTKYSTKQISIQYLSSGEKQLITFFTHLIFNVKDNLAGIFVVDEPELSLHLSWQKIFVEKVLEINENIQLIFATHSPEIIGKNRSKMYKLEKKYIRQGGEAYE